MKKNVDILVAIGILTILFLMVIPLPPFLLDILLSFNISAALVLLLVAIYLVNPLEITVFPSLLLILTLFRLSLNVSSTRLILGEAYAGEVIRSFGSFVVKGNYVLGLIIFLIIVIINFIVIVKGSGRIAEVAARFTLDAMPGKQMSIDADLNNGLITEDDARQRRENISREADFYGAMDGASKFVKGDAIAGLIITGINIVGGLIIGALQMNMPVGTALTTYTLLTIGDGLVTQIPALLVSTAAGIVVTRASSSENLGADLHKQLFGQPKALFLASGTLVVFGITPGLPAFPFFLLSIILFFIAMNSRKKKIEEVQLIAEKEMLEEEAPAPEEKIEDYLQVDALEIEIGYNLISLVDEEQGGDLFDRITSLRKQIAIDLGIIVPPIRIRDNLQLGPDDYVIRIRGNEVASGEAKIGFLLAMNPGGADEELKGIPTIEPAFGLPAVWILEEQKDEAELKGYTIVNPSAVLSTHLMEVVKKQADKLLGRQEVKELLENFKKDYPAVIDELTPEPLSVGSIQKVLQNLLREGIPIRDMVTVFETLADYAPMTKNIEVLTEYVRFSMADTIAKLYIDDKNIIHAITMEPQIEQLITQSLQKQKKETGAGIGLAPSTVQKISDSLKENIENSYGMGYHPIVVCSPTIRSYFKKLIEGSFPDVVVLSFGELPPEVQIEAIGKVRI